jgi:hypothetical protein
VRVSGKSAIIVGNKLIENWGPSSSAGLVPLGFKKAVMEEEDLIPRFSLPFFNPHTIALDFSSIRGS